jgi:hypothetical protein
MTTIEAMISDSIKELIGMLHEASEEARDGNEFSIGRKMGLVAPISVLQDQAKTFGVSPSSLSLPEEDIVQIIVREYGDS